MMMEILVKSFEIKSECNGVIDATADSAIADDAIALRKAQRLGNMNHRLYWLVWSIPIAPGGFLRQPADAVWNIPLRQVPKDDVFIVVCKHWELFPL